MPAKRAQPDAGRATAGAVRSGAHHSTNRQRPRKTSERVALEIVHDIVARDLREGDRLPLEAELVEEHGVSRASLREALRLLEVQGLIRLKPGPGGGPLVGTVDASHLARMATLYFHLGASTYDELMATQVMLEPLCAGLAARHRRRRTVMRPYCSVPAVVSESTYREHTAGFHLAVYELCDNSVLALLTRAVTIIVSDQVVATMDPVDLRPAILREHATLARAIAAGHADRAQRLMAAHFEAQHQYYRRRWPSRLKGLIEWR
jgi:GntR family transcriptional repressor for pyruvate dehydrogenase complex